jgi:Enoyl-CoA hydratase/isomerase
MQTPEADYFSAYRTVKMTRDAKGVLVVEFHSNGGPCTFSAQHHTEVVEAFHRIAQDRANKIVILTGAGGDFIVGVDWNSFGDVSAPGVWSQIHDEGGQVLENIANIRVPVIAAIEGGISPRVSYQAMESLRLGVIALGQDEPRHSCSTPSRCQPGPHLNGESWPKSCQTVRRSVGRGN